jgi:formamidopyrimidine-DNA glycosylase
MPELPEVQAVVDSLYKLINQQITSVEVRAKVVVPQETEFTNQLVGQNINDISRRGKYIIITLDDGYLIVHLRMTGKLYLTEANVTKKHTHVVIKTRDHFLIFEDTRRFGRLEITSDLDKIEKKLGPEPFDERLDAQTMRELINKNKNIKAILLDQSIIAGIGNIYADEILFKAKICPEKLGKFLTANDAANILQATREILALAIENKGTTIINFSYAGDQKGEFVNQLKVYKRARQKCFECPTFIATKKIAGRTTHFCANCQQK